MINKSKAYLSPLVLENLPTIPFSQVKNTYIFSDFRCLEPTLYLVLKGAIEPEGFNPGDVEEIFDLGDYTLLVVNLDTKYHFEYLCFKRGNYSWYRPEVKTAILKYLMHNVNRASMNVVEKIRLTFSKDPLLKKHYENLLDVPLDEGAELTSKIDEEEETFKSHEYEQFVPIIQKNKINY